MSQYGNILGHLTVDMRNPAPDPCHVLVVQKRLCELCPPSRSTSGPRCVPRQHRQAPCWWMSKAVEHRHTKARILKTSCGGQLLLESHSNQMKVKTEDKTSCSSAGGPNVPRTSPFYFPCSCYIILPKGSFGGEGQRRFLASSFSSFCFFEASVKASA